jgi:hypothetical protein
MLLSVQRQIIAKEAQNWAERKGFTPALWADLPRFPSAEAAPVWVAREPAHFASFPNPDADLRAIALRNLHDPDELSAWAFVPGLDGAVWIVRTKAGKPVGLN